jgi:hypothetical protein
MPIRKGEEDLDFLGDVVDEDEILFWIVDPQKDD